MELGPVRSRSVYSILQLADIQWVLHAPTTLGCHQAPTTLLEMRLPLGGLSNFERVQQLIVLYKGTSLKQT